MVNIDIVYINIHVCLSCIESCSRVCIYSDRIIHMYAAVLAVHCSMYEWEHLQPQSSSSTKHVLCTLFFSYRRPPETPLGRTRQETRQLHQSFTSPAAVYPPPQLPAAAMKPMMTRSRQGPPRVTVQTVPTSLDTLPSIVSGGSSPPHKTS